MDSCFFLSHVNPSSVDTAAPLASLLQLVCVPPFRPTNGQHLVICAAQEVLLLHLTHLLPSSLMNGSLLLQRRMANTSSQPASRWWVSCASRSGPTSSRRGRRHGVVLVPGSHSSKESGSTVSTGMGSTWEKRKVRIYLWEKKWDRLTIKIACKFDMPR